MNFIKRVIYVVIVELKEMKSNKQWINKSKKNSLRGFDAKKLDYIQKNSGINWIREEVIYDSCFSTPNHIRIPDLIFKDGKDEIILEHDTIKAHGELAFPNDRTLKRNQDYFRSDRNYIVLNADLAKHLSLDEAKLANYLFWHELSKINVSML